MRRRGVALAFAATALWAGLAAAPRSEAADQSVEIRNFAFAPAEVTISAGESVTWTNRDNAFHTATSEDGTTFDSGTMPTGFSYQHTFDAPGTFPYYCRVHPSMRARVVVQPAPGRATTTSPPPTTATTQRRATTTTVAATTTSGRGTTTTAVVGTTGADGSTTVVDTTALGATTVAERDGGREDENEVAARPPPGDGSSESDVTGWAMVAGVLIALVALAAVLRLHFATSG